ncbi:MAG: DUF1572 family protein [Phycisphaerae bacterium]|nr:DUF1572 family protein [Phycisphaerae bacterium]
MRSNDPFLVALRDTVRTQRALAEKAFAQVDDDAFRRPLDANTNSIAIVMKHLGGSLRSRFTEFLTTDGEKPDRNRDGEFVDDFAPGAEGRVQAIAAWNAGFAALERAIDDLTDADLGRTVTIRGEPHSVPLALSRALGHVSYHVGQIVLTARLLATGEWKTLTIPRGGSGTFNRTMAATWTKPTA